MKSRLTQNCRNMTNVFMKNAVGALKAASPNFEDVVKTNYGAVSDKLGNSISNAAGKVSKVSTNVSTKFADKGKVLNDAISNSKVMKGISKKEEAFQNFSSRVARRGDETLRNFSNRVANKADTLKELLKLHKGKMFAFCIVIITLLISKCYFTLPENIPKDDETLYDGIKIGNLKAGIWKYLLFTMLFAFTFVTLVLLVMNIIGKDSKWVIKDISNMLVLLAATLFISVITIFFQRIDKKVKTKDIVFNFVYMTCISFTILSFLNIYTLTKVADGS